MSIQTQQTASTELSPSAPTRLERRAAEAAKRAFVDILHILEGYSDTAPHLGLTVDHAYSDDSEAASDAPPLFICPWCQRELPASELYAVDIAERWTHADDTLTPGNTSISITYDGAGHFDGSHYETDCCHLPVQLPPGWTEQQ